MKPRGEGEWTAGAAQDVVGLPQEAVGRGRMVVVKFPAPGGIVEHPLRDLPRFARACRVIPDVDEEAIG